MKLNIHDIEETAKGLAYDEPTDELNPLLTHGTVCDYEFRSAAPVRVKYYRAGQELFFQGHIAGTVIGHCARCLEEYPFTLATDFSLVFLPRDPTRAGDDARNDQPDVGFYDDDEIDLSPLTREQIILALPTRPLCSENCKGLCPNCGANLNLEACRCATEPGDPRLAVLQHLKVGR